MELRAGGYSTIAVRSGAQVLGRAHRSGFDLLILELDLPGSSAQHMLRTMRTRWSDTESDGTLRGRR